MKLLSTAVNQSPFSPLPPITQRGLGEPSLGRDELVEGFDSDDEESLTVLVSQGQPRDHYDYFDANALMNDLGIDDASDSETDDDSENNADANDDNANNDSDTDLGDDDSADDINDGDDVDSADDADSANDADSADDTDDPDDRDTDNGGSDDDDMDVSKQHEEDEDDDDETIGVSIAKDKLFEVNVWSEPLHLPLLFLNNIKR